MARYKIVTLIDITRADPDKKEIDKFKLAQQSNFNTLIQAIGLRSNVEWNRDPKKDKGTLPDGIGGKATYWVWEFDAEREDVFLSHGDPVGLLKDDIHNVPIINNLENSADIDPAAFQTKNGNQNTWITII